jgi:hypothetical protein
MVSAQEGTCFFSARGHEGDASDDESQPQPGHRDQLLTQDRDGKESGHHWLGKRQREMAYADTRGEHVEHAFQLLFDTLPARLNGWRYLAELERAGFERTAPQRA